MDILKCPMSIKEIQFPRTKTPDPDGFSTDFC